MHSWRGHGQLRFQETVRHITVTSSIRVPLDSVPVQSPTSSLPVPWTFFNHPSTYSYASHTGPRLHVSKILHTSQLPCVLPTRERHSKLSTQCNRLVVSPPAQPPLAGWPQLLIQYTCSYPHLEDISNDDLTTGHGVGRSVPLTLQTSSSPTRTALRPASF